MTNRGATYCQWCGHAVEIRAHAAQHGHTLTVGRTCRHCPPCEAWTREARRIMDTRPAWVRRAMGEGSGALPVKEYR